MKPPAGLDLEPLCGHCRKPVPRFEEVEEGMCAMDEECLEAEVCEHREVEVQETLFAGVEYLCADVCKARLREKGEER